MLFATENIPLLFAQAADTGAAPAGAAPGAGPWESIILFLPVLLIFFWFFLMRPQQRQEEKQRKMFEALDKNDRVLTVGGLIGTIHLIDREHDEVVLKVDDGNGTKIRFVLSAIHGVLPKEKDKD